mmetsp:Transcript_59214/g.67411  ORF Transcript_59214/g.67411 Transcript_59214/m.67411 type:complete len:408 (-) Transcript_59214:182-1405(-)
MATATINPSTFFSNVYSSDEFEPSSIKTVFPHACQSWTAPEFRQLLELALPKVTNESLHDPEGKGYFTLIPANMKRTFKGRRQVIEKVTAFVKIYKDVYTFTPTELIQVIEKLGSSSEGVCALFLRELAPNIQFNNCLPGFSETGRNFGHVLAQYSRSDGFKKFISYMGDKFDINTPCNGGHSYAYYALKNCYIDIWKLIRRNYRQQFDWKKYCPELLPLLCENEMDFDLDVLIQHIGSLQQEDPGLNEAVVKSIQTRSLRSLSIVLVNAKPITLPEDLYGDIWKMADYFLETHSKEIPDILYLLKSKHNFDASRLLSSFEATHLDLNFELVKLLAKLFPYEMARSLLKESKASCKPKNYGQRHRELVEEMIRQKNLHTLYIWKRHFHPKRKVNIHIFREVLTFVPL